MLDQAWVNMVTGSFARQRPFPQRDNRQAVFGPTKSDCARPPSIFARFRTCWLLFVPKSEIPLELASLWLDFGHPESCDKYIKHHYKGQLLQRHPEAVWACKSVCTVRSDVCRKLNNISVISFTQLLFITPVLKLSRCTVYIWRLLTALSSITLFDFHSFQQPIVVWVSVTISVLLLVFSYYYFVYKRPMHCSLPCSILHS